MVMFGILLFSASAQRRANIFDRLTEAHAATALLFGT
jgi:hypothetical protein